MFVGVCDRDGEGGTQSASVCLCVGVRETERGREGGREVE